MCKDVIITMLNVDKHEKSKLFFTQKSTTRSKSDTIDLIQRIEANKPSH